MVKTKREPADYILPLYMNGLAGRMLRAPSTTKRKREILLIYGHHAMLERWWGLVENLETYGNVTMPDMPGFGGMESFAKIGVKPDIDAFADYLAAFIKFRYKKGNFTIYAISFGFLVVTRMLQKYPELAKRVDLLISAVGFMTYDDFHWNRREQRINQAGARLFATRPMAIFIEYVALNRTVVKLLTKLLPRSKHKFIEVTPEEFESVMDFDAKIWQANDVRTHWLTTAEFFSFDNTKARVNLPVAHVVSKNDHYLNNVKVEEHMRLVFSDYKSYVANTKAHVPHITATKEEMAVMVPAGLRRLLSKDPSKV